ncbi:MAG: hypothetical protein QM698_11585 [Micropepsaceae bacterium]
MGENHGAFALGITLLADRSPQFAAALPEVEPWRLHLIYAAIDLQQARLLRDALALGDALALWPLKRLAPDIFGAPLPGLRRALGRIGPFPMRTGFYRLLAHALACRLRRKLVFHAPQVSSTLLALLDLLPDAALSGKVLGWDHGDTDALAHIRSAVKTIRRELDAAHAAKAWRALAALENLYRLDDWLHEHLADATFPPPPWAGTATITPLTTFGALRGIAKAFRNCLWERRADNISGSTHAYLCREAGIEAVAAISCDRFGGWQLSEIKGAGNRALPPEALDYIADQFAMAGIHSTASVRCLQPL